MPRGIWRIGLICAFALLLTFPTHAGQRQMHWIMGTLWEIESPDAPAAALASAFAEVRRLDASLSHYKADSEVSRLNQQGHGPVSVELGGLIARCLSYSQQSGGAFDITVAPLVEAWGFKHLDYRMPTPDALAKARAVVGWQRLHLHGDTVQLAPGMRVEFGAIGKGYALDRAMAALKRAGVHRARIDAGGQHLVAGAWTIGIRHPRDDNTVLGHVTVPDGWSIATSGDDERGFVYQGKRYGHVLDPRTGWPAAHFPGVTVIAPTGELADMLSTTAAVLGPTQSATILARYRARALWYGEDGTITRSPGFSWQPD